MSTLILLTTGCATTSTGSTNQAGSSTGSPPVTSATSGMPGMPGMDEPMPTGDGLSASASGFTLAPATTTLPLGAGQRFTFGITTTSGQTLTRFQPDQTQLLHLYLIRSDLTGFAHLHPSMSPEGTWSVMLPAMSPGTWRVYTQFITADPDGQPLALVLSTPVHVPGQASTTPLPPPSAITSVDGYTLTLTLSDDQIRAGVDDPLTVTVAKDGHPVTHLQPYLDSYAHLTAIHDGDLAFAHLHPHGTVNGDHGGPVLSFEAMLPKAGNWRLFIQFQTHDTLHTAAMTVHVS